MRSIAALAIFIATPALAGQTTVLPGATRVTVATKAELSTKTARKGDPVALETAEDVVVGGAVIIPKGTQGAGEIGDMRAKGALGQRGKLSLRPLYLIHKGRTIRLKGEPAATTGKVEPGAILAIAVISPAFTGKSAVIPAGTVFETSVLRDTDLTP